MVRGDVAAVEAAVSAGFRQEQLFDYRSFVIPNLHKQFFPAISGSNKVEALEALGIVESFSVASLIEADAAVKTANVELIEIRLAMALGGKAFRARHLTGRRGRGTKARWKQQQAVGQKMLVNKVVIPHPRPELLNEMI